MAWKRALLTTLLGGVFALVPFGSGTPRLETIASAAPKPCAAKPAPYADFNGDGYADLAVGLPSEAIGASGDHGAVQIIYGSASGLSPSAGGPTQLWTQDSPGIAGDGAEVSDRFGAALAVGDFNGDGYSDLAIGVPEEDIGILAIVSNAGAVIVLYGSASGLTSAGSQEWTQDGGTMMDDGETDDTFGSALASGDFNGDGFADLAVGVPLENHSGMLQPGAVNVIYGSSAGLTDTGNQLWSQAVADIEGIPGGGDHFGFALAAGDFNGDGMADLAVGVPDDIELGTSMGAVNVIYGSSSGLTVVDDQRWHQNVGTIGDVGESDDDFGAALAAGDFNGDGRADLAVGVPKEDLPTRTSARTNAGLVNVIYGSATGLTDTGNQVWTLDALMLPGASAAEDRFGQALTAADLNGNGIADLAVGVPFDEVGPNGNAGAVNVIYGSPGSGLSATGDQRWHQSSPLILDESEPDDRFGWALAADDFNGNGCADLAVGVPFETLGSGALALTGAGALNVLYGVGSGLSGAGNQWWTQDTLGLTGDGVAEATDGFAFSLPAR